MEDNKMELMPGLYGSQIAKNRAVGYCHFHKAALTVKTMKCHECLKKQCDALIKYETHDFWRQHEQKKEFRKARKQAIAILVGEEEINMPTYREMREFLDESDKKRKEQKECQYQERLKRLEEMRIKPFDENQVPPKRCDHPNTMEDSTATVLWVVVMIISLLFKGGWALCILETIIWLKFITRYKK